MHFGKKCSAKEGPLSCITFALGRSSAGAEQQQVDEVLAVPHQQLLVLLNAAERAVEELAVLHVGLQVLLLFVPGRLDEPQPHQALRGAVGRRGVHLDDTHIAVFFFLFITIDI